MDMALPRAVFAIVSAVGWVKNSLATPLSERVAIPSSLKKKKEKHWGL